jgi:phosphate:Na+ symporter
MNMMSDAMYPLRESQEFINIMSSFSNPILGIAAGAIFTAIIQSSAASIGILQALAIAGVVEFDAAVFVLFGQNIGTCITALLASVGTNRAAKRTTIIHFMFNMIGTAIFTLACLTLPVTDWVASISVGDTANQIANMHTIFNIATTVLLIPFGTFLANFAERVLPDNEPKGVTALASLGEDFRLSNKSLGLSAVHTAAVKGEILGMIGIAAQNAKCAYDVILNNDEKLFDKITAAEETLDLMNKEVSQYISKILVHNNSGQNVAEIEQYFSISGNIERIGDHAINIAEYINIIKDKEITFSEGARAELREMQEIVASALERLSVMGDSGTAELPEFAAIEQKIDDITEEYREKHLERMREGKCSEEACILFSELLTDFERIGDHILNIAQAFDKINK